MALYLSNFEDLMSLLLHPTLQSTANSSLGLHQIERYENIPKCCLLRQTPSEIDQMCEYRYWTHHDNLARIVHFSNQSHRYLRNIRLLHQGFLALSDRHIGTSFSDLCHRNFGKMSWNSHRLQMIVLRFRYHPARCTGHLIIRRPGISEPLLDFQNALRRGGHYLSRLYLRWVTFWSNEYGVSRHFVAYRQNWT